jgi:hydrogenase maturation protease
VEATQRKRLVLGMGNLLLGDEGVGVHAAQALLEECPVGVEIQDIGTAILDALPAILRADRVIVLDAMKGHGDPGTIYRIPMDQCAGNSCIGSLHGFDLRSVLALAGREEPPEVLVLGVEPAVIEWSMELSPQVQNALPRLLEAVREELTQ